MSEIKIKVKIDGQESIQTIDELNKSLDEFKKNTEGLDEGSKEVDDFNKSIEELQKTLEQGLALDLDAEQFQKTLDNVSSDLTNITGQEYDIKVEVPENTIKSFGALKKEAQALRIELENTDPQSAKYGELESRLRDVSIRAAESKNRIDEFNEGIKISTGSPLEQFRNSLNLTKEGILNLDFDKAKAGFAGIGTSVKGLLPPLNSLKGAIIATGIGALIVAVGLLIANFDELKAAIFGVSDADKANLKTAEDRVKLEQEKLDSISDQENTLRLQGKTEKEILELKIAQTNELIAAQEAQIEAQKEIKKQQIETAERNRQILVGILNFINIPLRVLLEGVDKVVQFFDKDAPSLVEGFNDLINTGLDKVGIFDADETRKEAEETEKELEKSLTKLKNQRDGYLLSTNKSEQDARKKNKDEQEKYLKELERLNDKYLATEEERINKKYDEELSKIKLVGEAEVKLREAIIARRSEELKGLQDNRLDKERKTQLEILKLKADTNDELRRLELEQIDFETQIKLRDSKLTEDEKTLILLQAEEQRKGIREKFLNEETSAVTAEIDKQAAILKDRRDRIFQNLQSGIGILGNLDRLKEVFDEEKKLAEKQFNDLKAINDKIIADENASEEDKDAARKRNLELEKEYQKSLTQINEEEAELREEILLNEINTRAAQVQQAIDIVATISSTQLDAERSRLEQSQTLLDADYARRKELIENNIQDEGQRKAALDNLDKEVAANQLALDKQRIDLQKKQIKRERNFALAQIALESAKGIATALAASDKSNPISFALTLAANLAAVIATISKARNALKEADASAAALGAGGGGGSISLPSGAGPGAQQFAPTGFQPTGVNPAQGGAAGAQTQPTQPQQFVSVVEIERVRNSVNVAETSNTIFGGGG